MDKFINTELQTAEYLLQIKAIKLNLQNPFTWASGLKSPIYCDNRRILSFPVVRSFVAEKLSELTKTFFPDVEVIAGVATGGIAHGALVANLLDLPFVYIRSNAKGHGLQNLVEGYLEPGKNVLVIEDLVSTGMSSLEAVKALKSCDANVLGMLAVFTYGLEVAEKNFQVAGCSLHTLSNYNALLKQAKNMKIITDEDEKVLHKWNLAPEKWGK